MEQVTVNITKYKTHKPEIYEAWKEIWTEYSKEFIESTGAKYIWSYSEKDDGVYYFWVNIFPSKESRDAWTENYDAEAEQEKMSALIKEKTGFSSEELDEDKELDLSLQGMDIQLQNWIYFKWKEINNVK